MATIEELQDQLKQARERERETRIAAAMALQEAVRAKRATLYVWMDLARSRGSKEEEFREAYEEAVSLQFRADQGCNEFVEMALTTGAIRGLLSRFRL